MGKLIKKMGKKFYRVDICGLKRDLPIFKVNDNLKIAIFNILGDTEIVERAAAHLAKRIPKNTNLLVTPEVKSIPLAYELSRILKIPYVVARKIKKPYMKGALKYEVLSITTGKPQTLWLDGKDLKLIKNKNVVLVDDVVSTGSTISGLKTLVKKAGGKVILTACVFTEGNHPKKWKNAISLGNLPIFD